MPRALPSGRDTIPISGRQLKKRKNNVSAAIQKAMEKREKKNGNNSDRVLEELAAIGFARYGLRADTVKRAMLALRR